MHSRPGGTALALARLAAATVALAACSPALDWRDVRPEGGQLQLLMPCRPSTQVRRVELAGASVMLSMSACAAGDRTWAVAFADAGDPARIPALLQALQAATAANLAAAAPQQQPASIPGANPGGGARRVDLAGHLPDGRAVQVVMLLAARGTQVVQASVVGERLPAAELEPFVSSLRLGAAASAP